MKVRHKHHADIVFEVINSYDAFDGFYLCRYTSPPGRFAGRIEVSKADFEPIPEERWEDVTQWFNPHDVTLSSHMGTGYRARKIELKDLSSKAIPQWVFIIERKVL